MKIHQVHGSWEFENVNCWRTSRFSLPANTMATDPFYAHAYTLIVIWYLAKNKVSLTSIVDQSESNCLSQRLDCCFSTQVPKAEAVFFL